MRGSKPKTYPADLVAQVSSLYESGLTQSEVGELLGLSQKVIWKLMMRHNLTARVAAKRYQRGDSNHMWRGDSASYSAFHFRIQRMRGKPQACEQCGTSDPEKFYDWANLSGRYDDPLDYKRLCRSCHWKYDLTHTNLGSYAIRKEVPKCLQNT